MRVPGKTNKLLTGLHPLDRHGFECFGDEYNADVSQFLGFTQRMCLELEADPDPELNSRAAAWWTMTVLPKLQSELRRAMKTNDGSFFKALASHIEKRGKQPIDPLRAWICRLFTIESDIRGTRTTQAHADETSEQLYNRFTKDSGLKQAERPDFQVFTKVLREMNVQWRKRPGGPKKRRL